MFYYHNSNFIKSIETEQLFLENEYRLISLVYIFKSYLNLGMEADALEHMKKIVAIEDSGIHPELLDKVYQESGKEGIVQWFIDWLIDNTLLGNYYLASLYAIIEDSDKTIEYLEQGFEMSDSRMPRINNDPEFNFLRNDPYLAEATLLSQVCPNAYPNPLLSQSIQATSPSIISCFPRMKPEKQVNWPMT